MSYKAKSINKSLCVGSFLSQKSMTAFEGGKAVV